MQKLHRHQPGPKKSHPCVHQFSTPRLASLESGSCRPWVLLRGQSRRHSTGASMRWQRHSTAHAAHCGQPPASGGGSGGDLAPSRPPPRSCSCSREARAAARAAPHSASGTWCRWAPCRCSATRAALTRSTLHPLHQEKDGQFILRMVSRGRHHCTSIRSQNLLQGAMVASYDWPGSPAEVAGGCTGCTALAPDISADQVRDALASARGSPQSASAAAADRAALTIADCVGEHCRLLPDASSHVACKTCFLDSSRFQGSDTQTDGPSRGR